MNAFKVLAVALIIVGVLGLAYGTFTYTKDTHNVDLGPVEVNVDEKETVNIPVWSGVGAVGVGVLMLLMGRRR